MINKNTIEVNVLDHGFVKLIDYMGNDHDIACAARVLFEDWRGDKDINLLRYLQEHKHTTPLEHAVLKFHVKAPIFVIRQWHRHRTWSYNEVSARYKVLPEEYYIPSVELIGKQSTSSKQMRDIITDMSEDEIAQREEEIQWVQEHCYTSFQLYHKLVERGWPRELARIVLPFATYSEMIATVDAHNLMGFLRLRLDSHAQYEIQVYARALLTCMAEVIPITTGIFLDILNPE